jgi:hypothetical protein
MSDPKKPEEVVGFVAMQLHLPVACPLCEKATPIALELPATGAIAGQYHWRVNCALCRGTFVASLIMSTVDDPMFGGTARAAVSD